MTLESPQAAEGTTIHLPGQDEALAWRQHSVAPIQDHRRQYFGALDHLLQGHAPGGRMLSAVPNYDTMDHDTVPPGARARRQC